MLNTSDTTDFDYGVAFSRNIGWLTHYEQEALRQKKIAIAGMGGVGGSHLLTLIRLGFEQFNIADFDQFELVNFNRQVGATINTLKQPKAEALKNQALNINPNAQINLFPKGVNQSNFLDFLKDVDIFVDGLDFFEIQSRELIFAACFDLGIPAITAAPLGMGCAYIIFSPAKMSFEEYFRMSNKSYIEKLVQFLIGLSPKATHKNYLVAPETIDLANKKGPSTIMGCQLCASITATEILKLLLKRGPVFPAPYYHLFDAYQQTYIHQKLWGGNLNPLQKIKAWKINYDIRKQQKGQ